MYNNQLFFVKEEAMSVYIVTYDLNTPGKDYSGVLGEIKKHSWARLSESSYAIDTNKTVYQIYDGIKPYLDSNDNLYIITLTKPWTGYGPRLDQHLKSPVYQY